MNTPQWEDQALHTAVLHRDGYKCQTCRTEFRGHYVVKKDRNGPYTLDNLLTCCYDCHRINLLKDTIVETLMTAYNYDGGTDKS